MQPEPAIPPSCAPHRDALEQLAASGAGLAAAQGPLAAHLAECAACAEQVSRAEARARLLARLPRRTAPAALDARVAAEVARVPIERALARLPRHRAPAVLERLVAEELADPAAAVARRVVGGLPRTLAPVGVPVLPSAPARAGWRRIAGGVGLLAAAGLLVWLGGPVLGPDVGPTGDARATLARRERSEPKFRLVVVNSVDELDPVARGFAEGLAGRPLR